MIARVRGTVIERAAGRVQVLTSAGIAYEIQVPLGAGERLPSAGAEADLHTALVVRDDALELFGFLSARDRELFLRLQAASGVGPRLALAILGTLPARRVVAAIRDRDHAALQMVSGVGRKTAERIALELADKVGDLAVGEDGDAEAPAPTPAAALEALRALGYTGVEARDALDAARRETRSEAGTEELVKAALRHL